MKTTYRAALIVAAFVFLLPLSARSEIKAGSFEVNPFVGYNFFENDQNLKDRPIFGLRLGYNFTKNWGIEGVGEFIKSRVDNREKIWTEEGQYTSPIDDVELSMYHLNLVYHFIPDGKFNPFIVAGIGGAHYNPSRSNRGDMAAFNVGIGAKYWVTDNIALRVDLKDYMVTEIMQDTYHNIGVTAGVVFAFGGGESVQAYRKPTEAAAVAVAAVAVIPPAADTTAPTVIFTSPMNGDTAAPVNQRVQAAFSEVMDPATLNAATFTVKQGTTPIAGKVTALSSNGSFTPTGNFEKGKVYTGTITTGAKDLAGNALAKNYVFSFTALTAPKVVPTVLIALEDQHFFFDSSEVTENGKTVLNHNIRLLKENPKMEILIAGYTSASGTAEYNQKLSERRATAVREYFIKGGIARDRLTQVGYGAKHPAEYEAVPSDIHSEAAKANMRVLFEIIVR
ncbi:MAG: outer membrane beta-barrel domain-containing protein [Syntrophales bacterium]